LPLDYSLVFQKFHIWRLFTNFCFLGAGSPFAIVNKMFAMYVWHQPRALSPHTALHS
jgi:hypothetical protein